MTNKPRCIHILGASGAGVSTLGKALADALALAWIDADDLYWLPTEPPYTVKRPLEDRNALLAQELTSRPAWVLCGSVVNWSAHVQHLFTHIIFLSLPPDVRLARLAAREEARFGARVLPGGDLHEQSRAFLAWARRYDHGDLTVRSRALHDAWLQQFACPILELSSLRSVENLLSDAIEFVMRDA